MSLTLSVSVSDASMNCPFEVISVAESLVRQFGLLECFPCGLDVVEFGSVFGQPFDGEPMIAVFQCLSGQFAGMDRAVVEHQHSRFTRLARHGPEKAGQAQPAGR